MLFMPVEVLIVLLGFRNVNPKSLKKFNFTVQAEERPKDSVVLHLEKYPGG